MWRKKAPAVHQQRLCVRYSFLVTAALIGVLHLQLAIRIDQRTVAAADEADDLCRHVGSEEQQHHHDDGCPFCRFCQNDRHRPEEDADHVDRQYCRAVRQSHVQQTVVQMAFIRAGNRLFVDDPPDDGEKRVPKRNAEHHDGDDKGDEQRLFEAHDGERRQVEAQKQRAGVSHENTGRMEIEIEKAEYGSQQNEAVNRDRVIVSRRAAAGHNQCHDGHRSCRDRRYPCGQAVQAVDQVDGVGDTDNPEDRDRYAEPEQPAAGEIDAAFIRQVDDAYFEAKRNDDDCRCKQLAHQLPLGRELVFVIQHSCRHHDRTADEDAEHFFHRSKWNKYEKCNKISEINRQTTQSRHDPLVNLALVRRVCRSDGFRQFFHVWCGYK
jgi:hypothetical protein